MMSIWLPGRNASTPTLSMRPPLTTALTLPLMRPPSLKTLTIFSQFCVLGAFSGEDDHALVVLEAFEQDFDFVADFEGVRIVEFAEADDALGLVADVDEDFPGADLQNVAFDNGAFAEVLHGLGDQFLHSDHNLGVGGVRRRRTAAWLREKGAAADRPAG